MLAITFKTGETQTFPGKAFMSKLGFYVFIGHNGDIVEIEHDRVQRIVANDV